MVLGSGPIRIGQVSNSTTGQSHCVWALRAAGYGNNHRQQQPRNSFY